MGKPYLQTCAACRGFGASCWLCAGSGTVHGNGSAQTNNTNRKSVMAYEPVGRNWDNVVRASEEA